ncbi:hypothetical protein ABZ464_23895 [Streptomyces sp. NPDC005820]|uniref:hypothetical protein n=1 Tax=Streptomyces sp. NPDC005820 TaxID=3157069 RepID=UPI003405BF27
MSTAGQVTGIAPVDPATCNAIRTTAAGLLVPHTEVEAIAPGGNVGQGRSVDIDITPPADGACPETWTVGARLTPVFGQISGSVGLHTAAFDVWTAVTGAQLTLPEAGVYEVIADVQAGLITVGTVNNAYMQTRLFDVTAGAMVLLTARTVVFFSATPAVGVTHTIQATASASALYQVAGPTTIRVEGLKHVDSGTLAGEAMWAQNFRFKKIAD